MGGLRKRYAHKPLTNFTETLEAFLIVSPFQRETEGGCLKGAIASPVSTAQVRHPKLLTALPSVQLVDVLVLHVHLLSAINSPLNPINVTKAIPGFDILLPRYLAPPLKVQWDNDFAHWQVFVDSNH